MNINCFFAASCCDSDLDSQLGDPTELAILEKAYQMGITLSNIEAQNPRQLTEPFDTNLKRMSIFRADNINYVKGALESILPLCTNVQTSEILKVNELMSSKGLRILAVATAQGSEVKNLNFMGLIGISDPPRKEVIQAIKDAKIAGIKTIMITGDHPVTAQAIANEIGLDTKIYARATPEDKLKLVRELKAQGEIVAMTGDGVNDAPALQEAHIGIAMGKSGTEVTKQSADFILADDNYATIINAVRQGRGVYRNIQKAIVYLLTGNLGELLTVLGAAIAGLPSPFLAIHLLWINLVTDSLPALALVTGAPSNKVMMYPPRAASAHILGKRQWLNIISIGLLEAAIALIIFYFTLPQSGIDQARSLAFSSIVFCQIFRALVVKSGWPKNYLLFIIIFTIIIQLGLYQFSFTKKLFKLSPLTFEQTLTLILVALIPMAILSFARLYKNKTSY
ncbi:MAG: cation-translocating P-type ATPase [Oligoflexia bacterium]|nr:cation-translocating P-type ATPase [Oligoflexia bacterium]